MPTPLFLAPATTVTVWLTAWQLEEDAVSVSVGDRVEWQLTVPDHTWMEHLFAGSRIVDLALDTYVDAVSTNPVTAVSGVVTKVEAVTQQLRRATPLDRDRGLVSDPGTALTELVGSTDKALGARPQKSLGLSGFLVTVSGLST
jgi:hypothetical protein